MYAAAISVLQLIEFSQYFDLVWLISAIIHLLPVGFIVKLFLTHTPRTGRRLNGITVGMIGLSMAATLVMQYPPDHYPSLFMYILITFMGWLLYLNWYSVLPARGNGVLQPGNTLPALTLEDENKSPVVTATFLGKKTLYLFYRGNWCPLCMAQIKEISLQYKELEQLGIQMVLISPQPHSYSRNLAKKHDVPFIFLSDPKNKAAQTIGLDHKSGTPFGMEVLGYSSDTVLPTVVITDEKGEIMFVDQTDNYRVRPEPETFLKEIKALAKERVKPSASASTTGSLPG
jgi:peroxiredoxin